MYNMHFKIVFHKDLYPLASCLSKLSNFKWHVVFKITTERIHFNRLSHFSFFLSEKNESRRRYRFSSRDVSNYTDRRRENPKIHPDLLINSCNSYFRSSLPVKTFSDQYYIFNCRKLKITWSKVIR